jgi:Co/Zn/Cd efflux system component
MADACCEISPTPSQDLRYRRILWVALAVNAAMFAVEFAAGLSADSVSLLADAIDFLGDAANFGVSLAVLGLPLVWRARAALVKAAAMGGYGLDVLALAMHNLVAGIVPHAPTMGAVALLALLANVGVAALLYAERTGDSNRQSVWLCSRNDAIGNLAVMAAAGLVSVTGTGIADVAVAAAMAALGLSAAARVARTATRELASPA